MFAVHGLVPFTDVSANGAVVEEDEISLGCYGHYYGRRSPRLHWSRTNSIPNGIAWETRVPGRKLWEERKSNAVELGVHYATLTTTVKREMHGFMYKCATGDYYDNKISLAINISDNGTKWSLYRPRSAASYTFQPLVVYYKPSVTISPLNDTYVVGDRITMEVDARPMPGTYEWVGLSLNMVFKSRRLTITRHMVGNQTFVATATNNLLGKNLKGEYQFSFFVPTPPPRPTTTVSYKEHWVHVGRPHTSQVKMPAAQKRGTSLLFLKLFFLITLLSGICIGGLVLRKKTAKMTVVNEETYDVYETDDVSQVTGSDAVDDTVAVTGIQQQQQQLQQQYVAMPSIPKTSVEG
ncbi:hypothetical protein LSAT2_024216 [Lamellibrachia satsuma]|nr:hypothetical protein LSAT2_024216 [Lamellibrachia satsuma]